jgi:hypothetical protein
MAETNGASGALMRAPWTVRWFQDVDKAAVVEIMREAGEFRRYRLDAADIQGGSMIVEVRQGVKMEDGGAQPDEIRGYVWFDLGRPETWIRSFAVAKRWQTDYSVLRHLAQSFVRIALQHGSQGIAGFQIPENAHLTDRFRAMGASVDAGVRVWGNIRMPTPTVRSVLERLLTHVDGEF